MMFTSQSSKKQRSKTDSEMVSPEAIRVYTPVFIQAKLTVGSVDDPMEHEADVIADQVMRMPDSTQIQRKCAHCEEEEKPQRKPMVSFIQRKKQAAETEIDENVNAQIESSKGAGSPMSRDTKSFMESRFGNDFSQIKIHTDSNAVQLSKSLNAQAFAVGNDLFFNEGNYAPESESGKHLLAHELVHTIQQGRQKQAVQKQSNKDDPASGWETDQESFAKRMAERHLSTERKVVDPVRKVVRLQPPGASNPECLVTTEGGISVKVLWNTTTNKAVVKSCINGDCKACGYEYSVNEKGEIHIGLIKECWLIAEI